MSVADFRVRHQRPRWDRAALAGLGFRRNQWPLSGGLTSDRLRRGAGGGVVSGQARQDLLGEIHGALASVLPIRVALTTLEAAPFLPLGEMSDVGCRPPISPSAPAGGRSVIPEWGSDMRHATPDKERIRTPPLARPSPAAPSNGPAQPS